ncbi:MAG: methyl-accepting chemotaxis protein [Ramlibacter sp.]|jgi:methyl-accepting chemotaxis protein|nr:methyl-accepting chemotaxis protein [Ramlibacter sp.]MCE3269872.1 methyl-accepting chemotaxis protein [Ramlibacter sp.]
MRNLRTSAKLSIAFAVMASMVLACGLAVWFGMIADEDRVQALAASGAVAEAVREMRFTRWMMLSLVLFVMALIGALGLALLAGLRRQLGGEAAYAKDVVARIAAGDLASPVQVRAGAGSSLLAAMRQMQDDLRMTVGEVLTGASAVAGASAHIAQGNQDLSQRTEMQASTLQETASVMEELTSTVQQNAESARQASELAAQASAVARKGGGMVADVVGTMSAISDSSRRISDITGVIDGIAFQTNLLALNAAVEAARAGGQGRGFAVVAEEVRGLAERSAAAAREIKALVDESADRVEAGNQLVHATGGTMQDVVRSVERVSELIAEIAAAGQEQSSGIVQVNIAVSRMEEAVQQNASLVEEASAATESMKAQAGALLQLVSRFRLPALPLRG